MRCFFCFKQAPFRSEATYGTVHFNKMARCLSNVLVCYCVERGAKYNTQHFPSPVLKHKENVFFPAHDKKWKSFFINNKNRLNIKCSSVQTIAGCCNGLTWPHTALTGRQRGLLLATEHWIPPSQLSLV